MAKHTSTQAPTSTPAGSNGTPQLAPSTVNPNIVLPAPAPVVAPPVATPASTPAPAHSTTGHPVSPVAGFMGAAAPLTLQLVGPGGAVLGTLLATPKHFSSGSVGYYAGGKVVVQLANGQCHTLQVGVNLTVVGSKNWPQ